LSKKKKSNEETFDEQTDRRLMKKNFIERRTGEKRVLQKRINWTFQHTPLSLDMIKKIFKEGKMTRR
tara:strand:+ start:352 stop:552 length:201 start_codon:yes stop_codon:yes gene_type:complete